MIGRSLSHFRILEQLGAGGMGVVYRARDEKLERDVAIKVLPAGALADEAARRQFRKEALALSKLNHPNIETVHEFDSQEGVDYLVMELVPGETLSDRIAGGALAEKEIARLGEQLAEGLAAAHRAGILHRDIKPANIRITPEGRVKVLDFGLAKLAPPAGEATTTQSASEVGQVAGTLPYMAPEQLRAERLDERSDVYAAGAVLYEMATGARAFPQELAAQVVQSVLNESPAPPREVRREVSPELDRIVLKCLEKEPDDRYQSARELAVDLRRLAHPTATRVAVAKGRARRPGWSIARAGALAGSSLLTVAVLAFTLNLGGLRDRLFGGGAANLHALAVLPLANLSGDPGQEYFADGMTDELITRLAQVGALRVISRSSVMQFKGTKKPLRDVANSLNVALVVEGAVVRAGNMVRITAQLVEGATGRSVWAESYERALSNVLEIQSEVARAIVERVRVQVTPQEKARLATARAVNPEAHEAYLRGLAQFNQYSGDGFQNALLQFKRSIEIDPRYAAAYAGLAQTYSFMAVGWISADEANARARAAAARAIELDSTLALGHVALAYVKMVYDWDWDGAEAGFRRALDLNPSEAIAHQNYGLLLTALGRFGESESEFARARDLDPLSSLIASQSLFPIFEGRQYDRAIQAARRLIEADPQVPSPHMILGQALLLKGEHARGIAEIQKATELDPTSPFPVGWLGYAYATSGQGAKALEVWDRLDEWQKKGYVQPYLFALIQIGLGNKVQALDWLEKALAAHSDELGLLDVDPAMDPLRSNPRFQAILKRLNFPPRA